MSETRHDLTLEEIGEIAGVSRSTVSRVLNDHPHVRPEIRARVEEVIAETGYLPNRAARALVSNRTGLIGLVIPTDVDELFADPYHSALVHGIQDGCSETGAIFSIFPFYAEDGETAVLSTLVARGFVDGVIVTAGAGSERMISALRQRNKRMVVIGHPVDDRDLLRVDVENRKGSAVAVTHLFDLGRQRVGLVAPSSDYMFGVERLAGYRDALTAAGRPFGDQLVRLAEPTVEGGYGATTALLETEPDAIHVATDTMAVGALRALRERNIRVPDDIAVVGFDGLPSAAPLDPVLTTVVQPVGEVGRTAVELLQGERRDPQVVVLPTALRIGDSCGARRSSGRSV